MSHDKQHTISLMAAMLYASANPELRSLDYEGSVSVAHDLYDETQKEIHYRQNDTGGPSCASCGHEWEYHTDADEGCRFIVDEDHLCDCMNPKPEPITT